MTFTQDFLKEVQEVTKQLDAAAIDAVVEQLLAIRERGGRLFILGVGGSAGNASHAVNDFRKLCRFESYAPTDCVRGIPGGGSALRRNAGWGTA